MGTNWTIVRIGSDFSKARLAIKDACKRTLNLPISDKQRALEGDLKVLDQNLEKVGNSYGAFFE